MRRPNILFVMTDQQRYDTIAALGNERIWTPHLDRLVRRGTAFDRAYSSCPVCVPARWTIRSGREPYSTRSWGNGLDDVRPTDAPDMAGRCGPFLAQAMAALGYRTFGAGKFHAGGWTRQLGFERIFVAEEGGRDDDYADWLRHRFPQHAWIEQPHGERTEMYYQPQMSPVPAEACQEAYVADMVCEQLHDGDARPWFGFASFIGPHPPLAPPIPFNRMYDPDRMPRPRRGDPAVDHLDDQIPNMNHHIWAEDINDAQASRLYSRYYGDISYIDQCLGRILDAVEARPDADDTLIAFFTDHGDHMGDHGAWQKETFFEGSARIPFLLSWPGRISANARSHELVGLTDLFAIATGAAGQLEVRDGHDVLGTLDGKVAGREHLFGYWGIPGRNNFKIMVRSGSWKYIFMANGGRQQLFDLDNDPHELRQLVDAQPEVARRLRRVAAEHLRSVGETAALDGGDLKALPFAPYRRVRGFQTAAFPRGRGFPAHPQEALQDRP